MGGAAASELAKPRQPARRAEVLWRRVGVAEDETGAWTTVAANGELVQMQDGEARFGPL